ncbi:hypothetical protein SACE_1289 [Saccharopolyspora erythraea NRRL 2338]|uniref:Uncharacterized protein n=1 Tax=Saccharopolyspora erythraea (strain ATCC 11635 / DSM 40517 / JCM 4748 / NBRC 13426 / NCIMB 8594 / NRRL 2338) TaxID=405948 RepID=A4F987_SACEN|nr:hypothetical protein SACE_1289 [Saccharopolyspora erythraea NRRL 2338]
MQARGDDFEHHLPFGGYRIGELFVRGRMVE